MTASKEMVVLIYEDNHGLIGVANNYRNAIDFLINGHWIDDFVEAWDEKTDTWHRLVELEGEDWADRMRDKWDIDDFNDFWEDSFTLVLTEVFGTDKE